jgi:starch synthase (maltosyl-transferring)
VEWNGQALHDPHQPYHGQYTGVEETQRKPAYHNGTAWPWLFPGFIEALLKVNGPGLLPYARCLMGSSAWLMQDGVLGHLAEIVDGDAPHRLRGCGAQAWSVSEWVRVWAMLGDTAAD